jgi:hypothetical protein
VLLSTLFAIVISGFYTLDMDFFSFFLDKKNNLICLKFGNYVLNLCGGGGGNGGGDGVRVSGVSGVSVVGIRVSGVSVASIVGGSVPGVGNLRSGYGSVLDWCSNLVDVRCSNRCGGSNSVDIGGSCVDIRCRCNFSVDIGGSCNFSVDIGFSCNLDIDVGFSGDIFMNVGFSCDIFMNIFLSGGAIVNVFYGRDIFMNIGDSFDIFVGVGLSGDIFMNVGDGGGVNLTGIIVGVDNVVDNRGRGISGNVSVSCRGSGISSMVSGESSVGTSISSIS